MADPMDRCTICFETFAPLVSPPWPVSKLHPNVLSWPCGHRVHVACILQSLASLRSTETPCFVCRTPPFPHVRSYLEKWHGEEVALLEADAPPGVPAEDPPVPVTATYIPATIAALCCPRVLSYSADMFGRRDRRTRFVRLVDDRRMTFMGLDRNTGALQWTCLSCNQELSTIGLPGEQERARRICSHHGQMCFTFDCRGSHESHGAAPLAPYWSCMDHRQSLNDVALPINHLRIPAAVGLPIPAAVGLRVVASDDEESEGWSSRSAMSSTMSANATDQPMMEDTWIHQLVYSKARLQPHPCSIGHNAKSLKRGACFETHAARTDCCTPEKSSRESL